LPICLAKKAYREKSTRGGQKGEEVVVVEEEEEKEEEDDEGVKRGYV